MHIQLLAIDKITLDDDLQPRVLVKEENIQDYLEDMENGDIFPPLIVFYDSDTYWLADGYHRYSAYLRLGKKDVQVEIRQGSKEDAIMFSLSANKAHGNRRTQDDIKNAVIRYVKLEVSKTGKQPSQRDIAQIVGCSQPTVGKYLSEFNLVPSDKPYHLGQDEKIFDLLDKNPEITIRELAEKTGLSKSTIHRIKQELKEKEDEKEKLNFANLENVNLRREIEELKSKKDIESQQQTIFDLQCQIEEQDLLAKKAIKSKETVKRMRNYLKDNLVTLTEKEAQKLVKVEIEKKQVEWNEYEKSRTSYVELLAMDKAKGQVAIAEEKHQLEIDKLDKEKNDLLKEIELLKEVPLLVTDNEKENELRAKIDLLEKQVNFKNQSKVETKKVKQFIADSRKTIESKINKINFIQSQFDVNNMFNKNLNDFSEILTKVTGQILVIYRSLISSEKDLISSKATTTAINQFESTKDTFLKILDDLDFKVSEYTLKLESSKNADDLIDDIHCEQDNIDKVYSCLNVTYDDLLTTKKCHFQYSPDGSIGKFIECQVLKVYPESVVLGLPEGSPDPEVILPSTQWNKLMIVASRKNVVEVLN